MIKYEKQASLQELDLHEQTDLVKLLASHYNTLIIIDATGVSACQR